MSAQMHRLIWVDLEMTGLDCQNDSIIEIATVVTDADLRVIAEGPVLAIHQSDAVLARMDEWNTRQHGRSGLTARVRASTVSAADAEQQTLAFLAQHLAPKTSPMCGNSICQDRRFMAREMPMLEAFFHYRNLDVSTLKILAGLDKPDDGVLQVRGDAVQRDVAPMFLERKPRVSIRAVELCLADAA